jgi:hypothetical protein
MMAAILATMLALASDPSSADRLTSPPDQIHAAIYSWGSEMFGWTVDATGDAEIATPRPGVKAISGIPTDLRHLNIGPDGYAEIRRRMSGVRALLGKPIPCTPLPTDGPYGEVTLRRDGVTPQLRFLGGCQTKEAKVLYDALDSVQAYLTSQAGSLPADQLQ